MNTSPKPFVTVQACAAETEMFEIDVPSKSKPGSGYKVVGRIGSGGMINCNCPGFRFRGNCSHVNKAVKTCGWNAHDGPEVQNDRQVEKHICPRCGGETLNQMIGA